VTSHKVVIVDTLTYDALAWQVRFCRTCRLQPWQLWERRGEAWSLARVYEQYGPAALALERIMERLNRTHRRSRRGPERGDSDS
jgi:hypothetical protein